jgi:hypothetical protein
MSVKAAADECCRRMHKGARSGAAFTPSKAGLNRCGHAAEKPAGQAVVIPQDEGEGPYETAQGHGGDITIPILSRNEGRCGASSTARASHHAEF